MIMPINTRLAVTNMVAVGTVAHKAINVFVFHPLPVVVRNENLLIQ